jgi:hypothetical protein
VALTLAARFSQATVIDNMYPVHDERRSGVCTALSAIWIARKMSRPSESAANRIAWMNRDEVVVLAGAMQKHYSSTIAPVTVGQDIADPMASTNANADGRSGMFKEFGIAEVDGSRTFKHFNSSVPWSREAAIKVINVALNKPSSYFVLAFSLKPKGGHATSFYRGGGFFWPTAAWFDPNIGEYSVPVSEIGILLDRVTDAYSGSSEIVNFRTCEVKAQSGGVTTHV